MNVSLVVLSSNPCQEFRFWTYTVKKRAKEIQIWDIMASTSPDDKDILWLLNLENLTRKCVKPKLTLWRKTAMKTWMTPSWSCPAEKKCFEIKLYLIYVYAWTQKILDLHSVCELVYFEFSFVWRISILVYNSETVLLCTYFGGSFW